MTFQGEKKLISIVCLSISCLAVSACSTEESPDEVPAPIAPRNGQSGGGISPPRGTSANGKAAASPSSSVGLPNIQCAATVATTPQANDGTEKNGAIIRLADGQNLVDPILVYRSLGNQVVLGSFLAVDDMVFGDSGTHVTGAYTFELRISDGRSCLVGMSVSEEDALNKNKLNVTVTFP